MSVPVEGLQKQGLAGECGGQRLQGAEGGGPHTHTLAALVALGESLRRVQRSRYLGMWSTAPPGSGEWRTAHTHPHHPCPLTMT